MRDQLELEQVFIPITKNIAIDKRNKNIVIKPYGIQIILGSEHEHITQIDVEGIRNIFEISGHAIDEKSGRLVPTLHHRDRVKGILVAGRPQPGSNDFITLRLPKNKLLLINNNVILPNGLNLKIYVPYSRPDVNNSMKTVLVIFSEDIIVDKIIKEVFEKIYTITRNDGKVKEKVKKDIKGELYGYYALV